MSYPAKEFNAPKSYTTAWAATLILIIAFVIGLLVFPPLYDEPKGDAAGMVLFIGRFHPIFLHLPVGALAMLCIMELVCMTRSGEDKFGAAALLTLWVGAAGSVLAVLAGIMLSREGGYEGGNFTLHQSLALVGTAGVLLSLVIRIYAMGQGNRELMHAYRAVFFGSFGLMGLGAHFGGNMSHGNKFLTEHAPEPMKGQMIGMEKWMLSFVEKPKADVVVPPPTTPAPVNPPPTTPPPTTPPPTTPAPTTPAPTTPAPTTPAPTTPAPTTPAPTTPAPTTPAPTTPAPTTPAPTAGGGDKLVFQDVIMPIFEAKCNKCHNEAKSKGDLRMDTFEMVMKGGKNGGEKKNNIVPGKPDESLTIQTIILPVDDDDHMPPEGKDQLTPAEIAAIRYWVQAGASATQKLSDAQFPPEAKEALPK
jgi:uncharacterized membrane protein